MRSTLTTRIGLLPFSAILTFVLLQSATAQVSYQGDGHPWNQRAHRGPDAEVDGWYYNLGITGMRAQLLEGKPKYLLIKHVFADTPAHEKVRVGDLITGANGQPFKSDHKNGYGMDKFGADGPIIEFAQALEASMGGRRGGKLTLKILRGERKLDVSLDIPQKYGAFSKSYPKGCKKTAIILEELYEFLSKTQREDGSWGSPPHDTFAPLALLASGDKKYLPLVEKCVRMHARTTKAKDNSPLINWRYMAAAIVMSEYYLATKEEWVKGELEEVYDFLCSSQYTDLSQVNEKVKESHPHAFPKTAQDSHGGWGHNPRFEGYGPISMITGQGALAFALMSHCGIKVDRARHDAAYAFLSRATGQNGYVWYKDRAEGPLAWADMGRTGAAGIANFMSPYRDKVYRHRALAHAEVIGKHPESFADTHGSPLMGMCFAALAANTEPMSFRKLMDSNKWWFVLSQCPDGSFYYQPNRDNAGYGDDSRVSASAATAFILSISKNNLHITGKKISRPKSNRPAGAAPPASRADAGSRTSHERATTLCSRGVPCPESRG